MKDDIVDTLRILTVADPAIKLYETMTQAANEIERLRALADELHKRGLLQVKCTDKVGEALEEAETRIEQWKDIANRLYLFIQDPCTHNHWCDVCSSISDYEKAVDND